MKERIEMLIKQLFDQKQDFAIKAGIPPETLSRVLGRKSLSLTTLKKFTKAIPNLNLNWLINGKGDIFLEDVEMKVSEPEVIYSKQSEQLLTQLRSENRQLRQQINFMQDLVHRLQDIDIKSKGSK